MMFAAVAAFSMSASAAFQPITCDDPVAEEDCAPMVFTLTASGKTVMPCETKSAAYKTVTTLKISKGALVFIPGEVESDTNKTADAGENTEAAEEEAVCCYDTANLYAIAKIGKKNYNIALQELTIGKWSVFGKSLDAILALQVKKGSSYTLESDLFITTDNDEVELVADDDAIAAMEENKVAFYASAFGSMKVKISKGREAKASLCADDPEAACVPTWTPKNYSGWFAGYMGLVDGSYACFNCDCGTYDIFGGTWKATFSSKYASDEAAQIYVFKKVITDGDDDEELL